MVIKMSRHDIGRIIIGGMLDRRKGINVLTEGKHDNPAGMLPGRPPDSGTPPYDAVNLTVPLVDTPLLVIILHIAKCCFFCQCTYSAGSKGLSSAKNNLCIGMSLTLVFTREV